MKKLLWNYPKKQKAKLDIHCYPSHNQFSNQHEKCTGYIESTIGKSHSRYLKAKCQCKCHST